MVENNWYIITGGPSSGKTTLIIELQNLGYKTIPEAARQIIDENITSGISITNLRSDEKKFQELVLHRKIQIEKSLPSDEQIIFDRGMHDTIAYMRLHNLELNKFTRLTMERSKYRKIFLLDPLPFYTKDYARIETAQESKKIFKLLEEAYLEYGMEPIILKSMTIQERVKLILKNLK